MKQLAIVLVVILISSLCGFAQGETRCVGFSENKLESPLTGEVKAVSYNAVLKTDYTGETRTIEVSEETYELLKNEYEAEREHHDNLWYVKAGKWFVGAGNWCEGAFNDAVDWVTFWN